MWSEYATYCLMGVAVIIALLTMKHWGSAVYAATKHWRLVSFLMVGAFLGTFIVLKQETLKYELAYYYYTGAKNTDTLETKYRIRQCREFVEAKLDGRASEDEHPVSAGFITISAINNWDYCARTFSLNRWTHDISINGQDGGRLLCAAYARDTYRSAKVQNWCDTVLAPADRKV